MPTQAIRITVFLSSPGNLQVDRDLVKKIVSDINIDTGSRAGFFIDLVTWETHTHPAAGTHAQAVINEQIPENIDIFLGLMGHYFGTPTKEWRSGTEEEFRIAHQSNRKKGEPEIMFYFSEFVKSTREIDSKQLSLVEEFRSELADLGFLYGSYNELSEFGYVVRRHLNNCILKIISNNQKAEKEQEEHSFASEIESDYPFFESLLLSEAKISRQVHLDNATQDLDELSTIMERQNKKTIFLAKEMSRATQKIEAGKSRANVDKIREGIEIVNTSSTTFDRGLRQFIKDFRASFESLISNLQRYQIITIESKAPNRNDEIHELSSHMRPLLSNIKGLKDATIRTVSAFDSWPEEIEILRIRKHILQALLKDLDILLENSIRLGEEFCKDIEKS